MSHNRTVSPEIIVGTFVLVIFVILAFFTIIISGTRLFSSDGRSELFVTFEEVGGLRRHDAVLVRGVPVGQVAGLELHEDGVLVRIALNSRVAIHEGYSIRAQSSSLLGGMQLVIDEGTGAELSGEALAKLRGLPPTNVMKDINDLVNEVRGSLNEGGILKNFETAAADLSTITTRLREGEGTLGKLLSSDATLYNDLEGALADIHAISSRLNAGEGTLGKLLSSDSTLYDDLSASIASIKTIAARLENGEGTLGKLLSSDDTLYQDFSATIADVRAIADRLEKGEGSLGKLLSADATLYDDLAATMANLREVTTRLEAGEGLLGELVSKDGEVGKQLNGLLKDGRDFMESMRETSPITTFSSIFFGAF